MLQWNLSQVCVRGALLLAVAGLLSLAPRAAAQSESPSAFQPRDPCTPGVSSYVENTVISVTGLPYSATLKVTFDQQMSDGSMIHGVTRTLSARDSSGKTRMETSIGCWLDKDGLSRDRLNVRIADPLAGTFLEWSTGGPVLKVAHLISQPEAFVKLQGLPAWSDSESEVKTPGQPTRIVRTEHCLAPPPSMASRRRGCAPPPPFPAARRATSSPSSSSTSSGCPWTSAS